MTNDIHQILESAFHLPQEARAYLVEKLLESLDVEADFVISDEWKAEIARRCEQIDKGQVELIPGEKAFREAFEVIVTK